MLERLYDIMNKPSNGLRMMNRTRSSSKIGYLVKPVRGGFDYAGVGDIPIGVVTERVSPGLLCDIQVGGNALVFVGKTVSIGDELRVPLIGEGGISGAAYVAGNATEYTAIGTAITGGKGLINVALNISKVLTSSSPTGSYVRLIGDTMTGNLVMSGGVQITVDTINPTAAAGVTVSGVLLSSGNIVATGISASLITTDTISDISGGGVNVEGVILHNGDVDADTMSVDVISGNAGTEVIVSSVSLDNGAVDGTTLLAGSSSYGTLIDNDSITISGGGVKYLDFTTTGSLPVFYIRVDGEILGKFGDYEAALYYGNPSSSVRLQTTSAGITVTGIATVDGLAGSGGTITIEGVTLSSGDLEINNSIHSAATTMYLSTNTGGTIYLRPDGSGGITGQVSLGVTIATFTTAYVNYDGIIQVDTIDERGTGNGVTIEGVLLKGSDVTAVDGLFSGIVGIGTVTPATEFHVYAPTASGHCNVRIEAQAASDTNIQMFSGGTQRGTIGWDVSASALKFNYGSFGTTGIALTLSGDVGIGDESPSYKLDVNGTGRFVGTLKTDSSITADTYFSSSDTITILSATAGGTVYIRPNGSGSTTGQAYFSTTASRIYTPLTLDGHLYQGDSDYHFFGNSNDGRIGHDGAAFTIRSFLHGGIIWIQGEDSGGTNRTMFYGNPDGASQIRYAGSIKLETTNTGVDVTGAITATGEITAWA